MPKHDKPRLTVKFQDNLGEYPESSGSYFFKAAYKGCAPPPFTSTLS